MLNSKYAHPSTIVSSNVKLLPNINVSFKIIYSLNNNNLEKYKVYEDTGRK